MILDHFTIGIISITGHEGLRMAGICTIKRAASSGRGMPAIPALETRESGIQSHSQLHSEFVASLNCTHCLKTKQKRWSPFSGKYETRKRGTEIEMRSSCPTNQYV